MTMDRRLNPKWQMCWQSSQFLRILIEKYNQLPLLDMQHMGLSQAVGFCCIYFPTVSYPPERGASGLAVWNKGILASCPWKEQEGHATEKKQQAALIRHKGSEPSTGAQGLTLGKWLGKKEKGLPHCRVFAAPASNKSQGQKIALSCFLVVFFFFFKIYLLTDTIIFQGSKMTRGKDTEPLSLAKSCLLSRSA